MSYNPKYKREVMNPKYEGNVNAAANKRGGVDGFENLPNQ